MQSITIVKHEPERRRKALTTLNCGCSCCCCCCCLHTIGSIVGAAIAPNFGGGAKGGVPLMDYWDEEDDKPYPSTSTNTDWNAITGSVPSAVKPPSQASKSSSAGEREIALPALPSAVSLFWRSLCVFIFLAFVLGMTQGGVSGAAMVAIGVLMMFPALQLASLFATLLLIACWRRPDKSHQFKQLGKIAAGVVIGTVLGMLPMLCLLGAFSR